VLPRVFGPFARRPLAQVRRSLQVLRDGIITRQAIRRGIFTSVKDLIAAIETFIDGWNDRCQPFVWTKTADEILTKSTP
jgi:hypothetical protein